MNTEEFRLEAEALRETVLQERRWLHRHPGTGFQIEDTLAFVKEELTAMGLEPRDCGRSGLVALVGGK